MTAEELFTEVIEKAKKFGMVPKNDGSTTNPRGNSIIRKNISDDAFKKDDAFFAIINGEEETSGQYSDFSFVIFPEKDLGSCVVSLCVGSLGFKNDYQLASMPGLRRSFLKLRKEGDINFFKTRFDDIEIGPEELKKIIKAKCGGLKDVIKNYIKFIPACLILNFGEIEGNQDIQDKILNKIYAWLATYAEKRGWAKNDDERDRIKKALSVDSVSINPEIEVLDLLKKRHYVVLQGAPGTGKTYTALKIAEKYNNNVIFEQFHAETTFSDFVYGLEPNMDARNGESQFKAKKGILYQAINKALGLKNGQRVLLIIDEINRANLSNVLGPVFYLFEYQTGIRNVKISVGDKPLTQLPENLDVLATMNTADRSLAVVDFALRRRFAWYTLKPHKVDVDDDKVFMEDIFNQFDKLFTDYATDDELNLQPGQSYFIVNKTNAGAEMKDRLIYELMPLIKEYLAEGYLLKARDSFSDLFLKTTGKFLYE